jgi:hypothetical protein
MTTWLFNPFKYIAGFKSLIAGWIIILITAFIAYYSHTHFDGAIDVHKGHKIYPVWYFVAEPLLAWGIVVIVFFAAGKFFSSSAIRFIDIAGTFAFARWPFFFLAITNFIKPDIKDVMHLSPLTYVCAFISLGFSVWIVALMYNAFKVSCNIKGQKSVWVFIGALLIAEALSKVIFLLL